METILDNLFQKKHVDVDVCLRMKSVCDGTREDHAMCYQIVVDLFTITKFMTDCQGAFAFANKITKSILADPSDLMMKWNEWYNVRKMYGVSL